MTDTPEKKRILTGITTTGIPHLGNYVGSIRPAILSAKQALANGDGDAFFFLADYHGIIKCFDPRKRMKMTLFEIKEDIVIPHITLLQIYLLCNRKIGRPDFSQL